MKTKEFDCMQMKRLGAAQVQAQVQAQAAALTKEQELALGRSARRICAGIRKPSKRTSAGQTPDRWSRRVATGSG